MGTHMGDRCMQRRVVNAIRVGIGTIWLYFRDLHLLYGTIKNFHGFGFRTNVTLNQALDRLS
jgi:hypothetical protein